MLIAKGLFLFVLLSALAGCSSSPAGWSWQHPQGLDAAQRERDLADCMYYASITDPRAFGTDRPVIVQEWDGTGARVHGAAGVDLCRARQKERVNFSPSAGKALFPRLLPCFPPGKVDNTCGFEGGMGATTDTGQAVVFIKNSCAMTTTGNAVIDDQLGDNIAPAVGNIWSVSDRFTDSDSPAAVALDALCHCQTAGAVSRLFAFGLRPHQFCTGAG